MRIGVLGPEQHPTLRGRLQSESREVPWTRPAAQCSADAGSNPTRAGQGRPALLAHRTSRISPDRDASPRRNGVRIAAAAALGYYAGRSGGDGPGEAGSGEGAQSQPLTDRVGVGTPGAGGSEPPSWWRRALPALGAVGAVAVIVAVIAVVSRLFGGGATDEGGRGGGGDPSSSVSTSAGSQLTVRFAQDRLAKTWGDPPFRLQATASQPARITYSASGPCRIADARVSLDAAGACRVIATAVSTTSEQTATASLAITIAKARPTITADDASLAYARDFAHQLTAGVEPDVPLTYRLDPDHSPTGGLRCRVEDGVLTLVGGVNADAGPASLLPVTCPIEVAALASQNIEPGAPVGFDVTVTAPPLNLVADPTTSDVTGDNEITVTLTESTGFGNTPTALPDKGCAPGPVTRISPTRFASTITTQGGDYTCTITWQMQSWLGGPTATAATTITVKPPIVG